MEVEKFLLKKIEESYAHQSYTYTYFENSATIDEITTFLQWDAAQPAFNIFLRRWINKCPSKILPSLMKHIDEEESEKHSDLFHEMFKYLLSISPTTIDLDQSIISTLNYTFSEESERERSFSFFLGSFYATEYMSAKRCLQLYQGLIRLGVPTDKLIYLSTHFTSDASHHKEVLQEMILPFLEFSEGEETTIIEGVSDRLQRSSNFLKWYEQKYISNNN